MVSSQTVILTVVFDVWYDATQPLSKVEFNKIYSWTVGGGSAPFDKVVLVWYADTVVATSLWAYDHIWIVHILFAVNPVMFLVVPVVS